mmetsp:Transcript_26047/g.62541  ORF Transcript_26047/g.62541 Transcript_26047/m.62541 type:complete len:212 (-) Transcript_26047:1038-1673(-)
MPVEFVPNNAHALRGVDALERLLERSQLERELGVLLLQLGDLLPLEVAVLLVCGGHFDHVRAEGFDRLLVLLAVAIEGLDGGILRGELGLKRLNRVLALFEGQGPRGCGPVQAEAEDGRRSANGSEACPAIPHAAGSDAPPHRAVPPGATRGLPRGVFAPQLLDFRARALELLLHDRHAVLALLILSVHSPQLPVLLLQLLFQLANFDSLL